MYTKSIVPERVPWISGSSPPSIRSSQRGSIFVYAPIREPYTLK
jgi:hypothetical protein